MGAAEWAMIHSGLVRRKGVAIYYIFFFPIFMTSYNVFCAYIGFV
jgi:hypothetical protein